MSDIDKSWQAIFPQLVDVCEEIGNELGGRLIKNISNVTLPANTSVFSKGDACENYILILRGKVKVFTNTESGREIILYRLGGGDSCMLTTSCLFGKKSYPADATTETEVNAILIPAILFNEGLAVSSVFREFVFKSYGEHIHDLIALVEEVAFGRLDVRLARHLLVQSDRGQNTINATHQEIAKELGTAREVISRLLKDFSRRDHVELGRGHVTITDADALHDIASA